MLRKWRHRRSGLAQALAAFALLAIAFRALLPGGYMLAPTPDGGMVAVAYCLEHGAIEPVFGPGAPDIRDGEDAPPNSPQGTVPHSGPLCVFSIAVGLAPPEQAVAGPSAVNTSGLEPPRFAAHVTAAGLAAPPPWATGPPALI